ncbi:protein of unknown function [Candidatus Promineifilum breve]|uniref:Uncharacterized protein n=1 Tax=Candidatus Promineifilum breve TaxID=1806508 RepID=A0A160T915_9CHLR|nr:protein of unknown function [Candidatus Promineifilum breve]
MQPPKKRLTNKTARQSDMDEILVVLEW